MAVLDKKSDFFWSGAALDQWENLENRLSSIITEEARAILGKKNGNTISDTDMKAIIKKALEKLVRYG